MKWSWFFKVYFKVCMYFFTRIRSPVLRKSDLKWNTYENSPNTDGIYGPTHHSHCVPHLHCPHPSFIILDHSPELCLTLTHCLQIVTAHGGSHSRWGSRRVGFIIYERYQLSYSLFCTLLLPITVLLLLYYLLLTRTTHWIFFQSFIISIHSAVILLVVSV